MAPAEAGAISNGAPAVRVRTSGSSATRAGVNMPAMHPTPARSGDARPWRSGSLDWPGAGAPVHQRHARTKQRTGGHRSNRCQCLSTSFHRLRTERGRPRIRRWTRPAPGPQGLALVAREPERGLEGPERALLSAQAQAQAPLGGLRRSLLHGGPSSTGPHPAPRWRRIQR